eukprot:GHVP01028705.1.p1 GENE.GHVP01028705.1~~GHVP01028705.1.p1  ORF type:complete len:180 (+),score=39.80 GHVP01028705.1:88-627(+)
MKFSKYLVVFGIGTLGQEQSNNQKLVYFLFSKPKKEISPSPVESEVLPQEIEIQNSLTNGTEGKSISKLEAGGSRTGYYPYGYYPAYQLAGYQWPYYQPYACEGFNYPGTTGYGCRDVPVYEEDNIFIPIISPSPVPSSDPTTAPPQISTSSGDGENSSSPGDIIAPPTIPPPPLDLGR